MSFEHVDSVLEQLLTDKEGARNTYLRSLASQSFTAPREASAPLLLRGWLAVSVSFQLQSPWFSKDDVPFHVLDNSVRRDRVLGVPFMPAASWKGLLRWACRMRTGLLKHLETDKNELNDWQDSKEIVHLFGTQRVLHGRDEPEDEGQEACFHRRGALAFRPTWFDKIGFEVINPHDRAKKAGTKPILYEVVPSGARAALQLLYAPSPGQAVRDGVNAVVAVQLLLDAIEDLLTTYGFSAKRTSGWGLATITKRSIHARDHELRENSLSELRALVERMLGRDGQ